MLPNLTTRCDPHLNLGETDAHTAIHIVWNLPKPDTASQHKIGGLDIISGIEFPHFAGAVLVALSPDPHNRHPRNNVRARLYRRGNIRNRPNAENIQRFVIFPQCLVDQK